MPTIPLLTVSNIESQMFAPGFASEDLVLTHWAFSAHAGRTQSETGQYRLFLAVGGVEIGSLSNPRGSTLEVLDLRRIVSSQGLKLEADVRVNYPSSADDFSQIYHSVFLNYRSPSTGINLRLEVDCGRPVCTSFSQKTPTVDEHLVTWPGGEWASCGGAWDARGGTPLEKLVIDWGDGQSQDLALGLRYSDPQRAYLGDVAAAFSHVFVPDGAGNGSGNPVTARAVDVWGRRSFPQKANVRPEAKYEITVDETTGDFLIDTSESYGRTGRIVKRELTFSPLSITPDLSLDAQGRVFRVALPLAGVHRLVLNVQDETGHLQYSTYGTLSSAAPVVNFAIPVRRPPSTAVCLRSGALITARELSIAGGAGARFFHKSKDYIATPPSFNGVTQAYIDSVFPYGFKLVVRGDDLRDVTAPRLAVVGSALYLAGRHKSGQTRLWRSEDEAREWEEIAMIWEPDYFHADFETLIGGGAISAACKRVDLGNRDSSGGILYRIELWFRKTADFTNWESEPVLVGTQPTQNGMLLDETLRAFPMILNEALAGGSNRLFVGLSTYDRFYESTDGGAEWRVINN